MEEINSPQATTILQKGKLDIKSHNRVHIKFYISLSLIYHLNYLKFFFNVHYSFYLLTVIIFFCTTENAKNSILKFKIVSNVIGIIIWSIKSLNLSKSLANKQPFSFNIYLYFTIKYNF